MEILLISGLSGGGKSKAASFLEDMGFYIVDNMPAGMILKFAEFCAAGSRYNRVALVYDVRTAENFDEFLEVVETLRRYEYDCKLLFLEADVHTIIKRYKETRRIHPLQERSDSLEDAVNREIALMAGVRAKADIVLDSTTFSTARLKGELARLFCGEGGAGEMTVSVVSFGFKHGIPMEADLVFDVRFMPNPFYIDELRHQTGLDAPVRDYVFSFRETGEFMGKLRDMIGYLLPRYREEGKTVLVIAIGCTGGHHRSVAVTHALSEYITSLGYRVAENHRDMTRS